MSDKNDKPVIIKKETMTRLLRDVKEIIRTPLTDNGIHYIHDDENMMKGYAMIIGQSDTPYYGGYYFFEINYPYDYPHSPPVLLYSTNGETIRFNPNLYTNGKVCVSLLNTWRGDQWTSCQTISTVLLTLCTILCKDPLLNEPGITRTHPDFKNYSKIIEFKNIDIAILDIISKKQFVYKPFFDKFYSLVLETFLQNKDKIYEFLNKKVDNLTSETEIEKITTNMYNMSVVINYKSLMKRYKKICDDIP